MQHINNFRDPIMVRGILSCRTHKKKIFVPVDCNIAAPAVLPAITELVSSGMIIFLDRTVLPVLIQGGSGPQLGINVDIYLLTKSGVDLCNENSIPPNHYYTSL